LMYTFPLSLFFPQKNKKEWWIHKGKKKKKKRCTGASISSQVVCQKRIASDIYGGLGGRSVYNRQLLFFYFISFFLFFKSFRYSKHVNTHTHTGYYRRKAKQHPNPFLVGQ
jgi:hypothetical protein